MGSERDLKSENVLVLRITVALPAQDSRVLSPSNSSDASPANVKGLPAGVNTSSLTNWTSARRMNRFSLSFVNSATLSSKGEILAIYASRMINSFLNADGIFSRSFPFLKPIWMTPLLSATDSPLSFIHIFLPNS